jgi:hypothetical protein
MDEKQKNLDGGATPRKKFCKAAYCTHSIKSQTISYCSIHFRKTDYKNKVHNAIKKKFNELGSVCTVCGIEPKKNNITVHYAPGTKITWDDFNKFMQTGQTLKKFDMKCKNCHKLAPQINVVFTDIFIEFFQRSMPDNASVVDGSVVDVHPIDGSVTDVKVEGVDEFHVDLSGQRNCSLFPNEPGQITVESINTGEQDDRLYEILKCTLIKNEEHHAKIYDILQKILNQLTRLNQLSPKC